MVKLSPQSRKALVEHWLEHKSVSGSARQFNVTYKVAQKWIARHQSSSAYRDAPRSGRPPSISSEMAAKSLDMLMSNQHGGVQAVSREVCRQGLTSGVPNRITLSRAMQKEAANQGFVYRPEQGKPDKRMNDDTKQKRLAFCTARQNKRRCWAGVMYTDRCKFQHRYPGESVPRISYHKKGGPRRKAKSVNHAASVNVYAGITKYGVTKIHIVAGGTTGMTSKYLNKQGKRSKNITSSEYEDVLRGTFLPQGKLLFSRQGIAHWVLQQDNDPTHAVAKGVIKQWNEKNPGHTVTLLANWPPNSPDLNPIENLWGDVQARLDAAGYQTFKEFKAGVEKELKNVDLEKLKNLVNSMNKRLASCINLQGEKTKY